MPPIKLMSPLHCGDVHQSRFTIDKLPLHSHPLHRRIDLLFSVINRHPLINLKQQQKQGTLVFYCVKFDGGWESVGGRGCLVLRTRFSCTPLHWLLLLLATLASTTLTKFILDAAMKQINFPLICGERVFFRWWCGCVLSGLLLPPLFLCYSLLFIIMRAKYFSPFF